MKRNFLILSLVATAAFAEAPIAPVSDALGQNNPAAPSSIAALLTRPHRYADKHQAVFQWTDGPSAYSVYGQYLAAFQNTGKGAGMFSAGYTTPAFGAGLGISLNSSSTDPVAGGKDNKTFAPDGFRLFGSMAMGELHPYASARWVTKNTTEEIVDSSKISRSDSVEALVGVRAYVTGDQGLAWDASFSYGYDRERTKPGEAAIWHTGILKLNAGYRITVDKILLLPGLDLALATRNGVANEDYSYLFQVNPKLATWVPLVENWTLKGGIQLPFAYNTKDDVAGKPSLINSTLISKVPTGNVGLRYDRGGRWAVEAGVATAFLDNGPYFISGTGASTLYNFGFTVSLD